MKLQWWFSYKTAWVYLCRIKIATTLPDLQLFLYPLLNPVIKTFTSFQTFVEKSCQIAWKCLSSRHNSRHKKTSRTGAKWRIAAGGSGTLENNHLTLACRLVCRIVLDSLSENFFFSLLCIYYIIYNVCKPEPWLLCTVTVIYLIKKHKYSRAMLC